MVTWTQMYMPMGGLGLSALVALIPIIFFFVALAVLRLKGHVAGAITLILSILIAIFAFKMPIDMAFAAAGYGFIYGLWPTWSHEECSARRFRGVPRGPDSSSTLSL